MQGDRLGRYRLLERIGIGGMAEVYTATDDVSDSSTVVVVKRLLPQHKRDVEAVGMFLDEARLGLRLRHPHIVGVVDHGEADDEAFMVLEYVDGIDVGVLLHRAQKRGIALPLEHAVYMASCAARGLDHAHRALDPETQQPLGVVHRDVSPSNLLVGRGGDVKVADFGAARSAVQSARTGTGAINGTIASMSPEQLRGDVLDVRSDVYALGIVVWELLAGCRLYDGRNEAQIIQAVQRGVTAAPSTKNAAVPKVLDQLVLRCLAFDPARRPGSAAEVAEGLEVWLDGVGGRQDFARWLQGDGAALFEPDAPGLASLLMAGQRRPSPHIPPSSMAIAADLAPRAGHRADDA